MATFGFTLYGQELYGVPPGIGYDVGLVGDCPAHGVAVLTWTAPAGDWARMRLIRNLSGYPDDENDGTVLLDQTSGATRYTDTDLTGGRRYYYAVWLFSSSRQLWVDGGHIDVLITADHHYVDVLYDRLPQVYKTPVLDDLTAQSIAVIDTWSDLAANYANWSVLSTFSPDWDSLGTGRPSTPVNPLYRFLSLFGFALDDLRTRLDDLLHLTDSTAISPAALGAALAQFGWPEEHALGTRTQRRLYGNATELFADKGTERTLEQLAEILTGWNASVRTGVNLLLDQPDSLTQTTVGRWDTATVNATVTTTVIGTTNAPHGDGYLQLTATGDGNCSISFAAAGDTGVLHAVPVTQGLSYVGSVYAAGSTTAAIVLDFYDVHGNLLSSAPSPTTTVTTDWATRLIANGVAPPGAFRVALRVTTTLTKGSSLALNAAQLESFSSTTWASISALNSSWTTLQSAYTSWTNLTGRTVTAWEPPRRALVRLDADMVNQIHNPTGRFGATGWSNISGSPSTLTYTWSSTQTSANDVRTTIADPLVAVQPGSAWTFMADVSCTVDADAAPLLNLYAGAVSVGTMVGTWTHLSAGATTITYTYTVPQDGSVTAIQAGVAITRLDMPTAGPLSSGTQISIRNAALIAATADNARYFDGSTSSSTADYAWEGTPHNSRSHYYSRRTIKTARLLTLAEQFVPLGVPVSLLYAQPDVTGYGSDRAVQNYDTNPAGPPLITIGRSLDIRWAREQTWSDLAAAYTNWSSLTAGYPNWWGLLGVPASAWINWLSNYPNFDAITATGLSWAALSTK